MTRWPPSWSAWFSCYTTLGDTTSRARLRSRRGSGVSLPDPSADLAQLGDRDFRLLTLLLIGAVDLIEIIRREARRWSTVTKEATRDSICKSNSATEKPVTLSVLEALSLQVPHDRSVSLKLVFENLLTERLEVLGSRPDLLEKS